MWMGQNQRCKQKTKNMKSSEYKISQVLIGFKSGMREREYQASHLAYGGVGRGGEEDVSFAKSE